MGRRIICDEALERERQLKMFVFEKELVVQGYRVIAGVDEAGRGPLAGPVVAAAVVLPRDLSTRFERLQTDAAAAASASMN